MCLILYVYIITNILNIINIVIACAANIKLSKFHIAIQLVVSTGVLLARAEIAIIKRFLSPCS